MENPGATAREPQGQRSDGSHRHSVSFRRRLLLLVLALTIPAFMLAAGGLYSAYRSERRATESLLIRTARALALSVDRDIGRVEASLKTLGLSPSLEARDLAAFHRDAARVAALQGFSLLLSSADGTPLLISEQPYGQAITVRLPADQIGPVSAAHASALSFEKPLGSSQWTAALHLPVRMSNGETYILTAYVAPQAFAQLMKEQGFPGSDWVGAIVDNKGRVVVRSRASETYTGLNVSPSLQEALSLPEGSVQSTTLDNVAVRSFFSRSPRYGWYFVVGYPGSEWSETGWRSLAWLGALAAAIALGLIYALGLSRELVASVQRLLGAARALGRGPPGQLEPTGVTEFDDVQTAFADTAAQLHTRNGERNQAVRLLKENEQRLELALEAGALGTWNYDARHGVLSCSERGRAIMGLPARSGLTLVDLGAVVHQDDRERLQANVEAAIASGSAFSTECRTTWPDLSVHWVDIRGLAVPRTNALPLLIGTLQDITQRKTAESRQDLLLRELNHRVKNSLATVQSIALLTRRSGAEGEAAWEAFEQRLIGLAKTHDLLTAESWDGAALTSVLANELDPYQDTAHTRIQLRGLPLRLNARATLTLGLSVHELATNAAKYGCLSQPAGRLSVVWRIVGEDDARILVIIWQEQGGPPVSPPTHQGFGSKLLDRGLRHDLGADILMEYEPAGLRCTLRLPLLRVLQEPERAAPRATEAAADGHATERAAGAADGSADDASSPVDDAPDALSPIHSPLDDHP